MLEIDREVDDERPAPSVGEAQVARAAAQDVLQELPKERARLVAEIASAVSRGDFETSRRFKDELATLEDRQLFARDQLARAERVCLSAELRDAEADAREATKRLEQSFRDETAARLAHNDALAALHASQAHLSAAQARVQSLRQQHSDLERTQAREG